MARYRKITPSNAIIDPFLDNFETEWSKILGFGKEDASAASAIKESTSETGKEKNKSTQEDETESVDSEHEVERRKAIEENKQLIVELKENFKIMSTQFNELKSKYSKSVQNQRQTEIELKELQVQIEILEEENTQLQKVVKDKVTNNRKSSIMLPTAVVKKKIKTQDAGKPVDFSIILMDIDDDNNAADDDIKEHKSTRSLMHMFSNLTKFILLHTPFGEDVKQIKAFYGGGVASYFDFLRWIMANFIIVGIVCAIFCIVHILTIFFGSSHSGLVDQDGLVPGFMQFSSFSTHEGFLYVINILICDVLLIGLCVSKLILEDRNLKYIENDEKEENISIFAREILCGWDHSLVSSQEITNYFGLMTEIIREKVAETTVAQHQKVRPPQELIRLYLLRCLGLILYISVQSLSYVSIIYLTIQSKEMSSKLSNLNFKYLDFLSAFIVPACVTAINSITPMIFQFITTLEKWDSGRMELNVLLFRMYVSNMMNVLILAVSFAMLADPYLLADEDSYSIRQAVEKVFLPEKYQCRMNQASDGLFSLILVELFVNASLFLISGYTPVIITKWFQPTPSTEFNIAQRMVALLYFVSLVMLAYPFMPLTLCLIPIMLALRLKFEKVVTMKYYKKPVTVWAAHKAGNTFVLFFMVSLICVGLPSSIYFLSSQTFSKNCNLQDNFVDLCDTEVSSSDEVCTLDPSNSYYHLYGDQSYCAAYPLCICEYACGPFVSDSTPFNVFRESVMKNVFIKYIYMILFEYSYGAWTLTITYYILSCMRKNTVNANGDYFANINRTQETIITSLEAEKKKHERVLQRLKLIEGPGVHGGGPDADMVKSYF